MMYRGKLASSELFTILGGFISSFLFLVSLTVSPRSPELDPFSYKFIAWIRNPLFYTMHLPLFSLGISRKHLG
ncbi:hypothetical protein V6Z11_D02G093700 [Gossypium hirsutum]